MRLIEALRYTRPTSIAFVGAGGKTTALFRTAREIITAQDSERKPKTVLVTTSTHMGVWQTDLADQTIIVKTLRDIEKLRQDLPAGVVLITGERNNHLLGGIKGVLLDELQRISEEQAISLLIEADGAHYRPLKAPAEHEPAIPDFTKQVVVVAGMTGLGKPLTAEWVHRPELFSTLSGLQAGEEINEEAIIKMIKEKHGGLKSIPRAAKRYVLLNQADGVELQSRARRIGEGLVPTYHACIVASLSPQPQPTPPGGESGKDDEIQAVIEPIGGIILAAGGSIRFGKLKPLLPWNGLPLVEHVALSALKAGLAPVEIVVGNSALEVAHAVKDLPVRIVNNSEWENGLSTSIRAGLEALPDNTGGVIFLQCDQPQVPHALIRSLIEAHEITLHPIIAPQVDGQRGNPVLFDARTYPELLSLTGDTGGRALFARYPVHWVSWHDPHILLDIDTPEDYAKFLEVYPPGEAQR